MNVTLAPTGSGVFQATREGEARPGNRYLEFSSEMAEYKQKLFPIQEKLFYEKLSLERLTLRVLYTQMGGAGMMDWWTWVTTNITGLTRSMRVSNLVKECISMESNRSGPL